MKAKLVNLQEESSVLDFVKKAAEAFSNDSGMATFTLSEVESSCLFAVRWGLGDDCILVFKLDEDFQPRIFQQVV